MRGMYIVIAVVLAIVLAVFVFVKLPTPPGDEEEAASGATEKVSFGSMLKRPYFALGVLAEFIFIGLQVGPSFFSSFKSARHHPQWACCRCHCALHLGDDFALGTHSGPD